MIRTIAIDDEPLALKLVTGYIERTPFMQFAGGFDNPISALEYMNHNSVDAAFVDIQMPDLNGTDFVRMLQGDTKVVFTTAYEQYALEGFKLDVVDYLLKPFGYEDFLRAALKVRERLQANQQPQVLVESNNQFLFLKSDYKVRRINFEDIRYVEGLKDYVKVFLKGQSKPLLSLVTLKQLETRLPTDRFMRIHRSFIVNLGQIELIERNRIVFGDTYIPVGDQYKDGFQDWVDRNFV